MKLRNQTGEIFVPDGAPVAQALARTTHMAISAHQDDLEIMAYRGILECFGREEQWFLGVVATNGAGSPRDDLYKDYTDEQMQVVRRKEQKKAAYVGEYGALALLDYSSAAVKDAAETRVKEDLKDLLLAARPSIVYTHNLADKHDTHVAVTLRTLQALRELPADARPARLLGCEVWRDLDWMEDADKVALDVAAHENLAAALLGVFDSQICGGKRYDLATVGRRRAHATYFASHGTDDTTQLTFAMDLTPLMNDSALEPAAFVQQHIDRFAADVRARIGKLM
ncbi:MAG: PIG-L family deacetylase [Armatimonadota bacterium]|nr:PIG-L family deacetylase [Armatimonadota bacterium]